MRAGDMDRRIKLQRGTNTVDEYGTPIFAWTDIASLWAQIIKASTEEFIRGWGASDETLIIFRTRYIAGLTLADRLIHDGLIHNIVELKELGRREGLEIRSKSTGTAAPPEP